MGVQLGGGGGLGLSGASGGPGRAPQRAQQPRSRTVRDSGAPESRLESVASRAPSDDDPSDPSTEPPPLRRPAIANDVRRTRSAKDLTRFIDASLARRRSQCRPMDVFSASLPVTRSASHVHAR